MRLIYYDIDPDAEGVTYADVQEAPLHFVEVESFVLRGRKLIGTRRDGYGVRVLLLSSARAKPTLKFEALSEDTFDLTRYQVDWPADEGSDGDIPY